MTGSAGGELDLFGRLLDAEPDDELSEDIQLRSAALDTGRPVRTVTLSAETFRRADQRDGCPAFEFDDREVLLCPL